MIQPNQLLLIPRRLGMLRPGIHRVVFTDPKLDIAALYWMAPSGRENQPHRKTDQRHKPVNHSLADLEQFLGKEILKVEEATLPALDHEKMEQARKNSNFKRNKSILEALIEPEMLFRLLCANQWNNQLSGQATRHNVSRTLINRLIGRYFELQMDLEIACIHKYRRKNIAEKRKVTKKLGRKPDDVKAGRASKLRRNASAASRIFSVLRGGTRMAKSCWLIAFWLPHSSAAPSESDRFPADRAA
jgi:hypothetical protein